MNRSQSILDKITEAERFDIKELYLSVKEDCKDLYKLAQKIYDNWNILLYQGEGLCDEIAKYFCFVINKDFYGYEARVAALATERHVLTAVTYFDIVDKIIPIVTIDIDWHKYETYDEKTKKFSKIPNVKFKKEDVEFKMQLIPIIKFKSWKKWDF